MRGPKFSAVRRKFALVLFAFLMFEIELAAHKYDPFPYPQLRSLKNKIARSKPVEVLSHQYSSDPQQVAMDRNIESALLPLKVKGIRVSDYFPVPKVAGGITAVRDNVVVLDRLGNLYLCSPDGTHLDRLEFPALPNNIADYLKVPGADIDEQRFRAYDIEYLPSLKMVAVSHEHFDPKLGKSRLAVSVIPIDDIAFRPTGLWKTIFLSDPEPNGSSEEAGGRLAVGEPHKLYLTIGCYFDDSSKVSQDSASSFGKVIEINLDTNNHRVVSVGHRNPQGLTLTSSGALFSTEHGPRGGDELNLIAEGSNYGWPNVSLGTEYKGYDAESYANVGEHTNYQSPVFAWVPSIGPSNLIEVRGFDRRWNGDLLVASLKANSLFRLRLEGTRVLYAEPIWIGQRIRDILQLKNGTIVLWTDDTQLLFVSVDREQLVGNLRLSMKVSEKLHSACMYCHHFGPTTPGDFAPSLSNIFSRKIGSDNFRYSEALRGKEGHWTEKALKEFLSSPANFANGTNMPNLSLNAKTINEIVEVLKSVEHAANSSLN